jgi:hypothetical protein
MVYIVGVAMNTIAEATRWTKVVKRVSTTLRFRSDMLNSHCINRELLVAVNTVAPIGLDNPKPAVELLLFLLC